MKQAFCKYSGDDSLSINCQQIVTSVELNVTFWISVIWEASKSFHQALQYFK